MKQVDNAHYRLLRHIEAKPHLTLCDLAREMGVNLGKVNYCPNALVDRGWLKARKFRNSRNKAGYAYLLTPRAVEQKAVVTLRTLQRKLAEYESHTRETAELRREVGEGAKAGGAPHASEAERL
jgi:EPS-associated MarR family transcriptional regulator